MTLQIGVATPDDVYAKRFMEAASNVSSEQNKFRIIAFTKEETLDHFMNEDMACDVLLLSPSFAWRHSWTVDHDDMQVIYLSDVPVPNDLEANHISPYQPASAILSQLAALVTENKGHRDDLLEQTPRGHRLKRLKVNAVFSAAGGSGKTTTALQWVRRCSAKGERLLYLNLEFPSGAEVWLTKGEKKLWDELLYFVKEKSERLYTKLSSYLLRDAVWNFSYFPSMADVDSIKNLNAEDIAFLLQAIEENGSVDRVVLDTGHSHFKVVEAVFMHAELVLWILTEDLMAQEKEKLMFKEIQNKGWLKQETPVIQFTLNRRLSQNNVPEWIGPSAKFDQGSWLPYVPKWKLIQHKADWDPPVEYVHQMDYLLEKTEKERMPL